MTSSSLSPAALLVSRLVPPPPPDRPPQSPYLKWLKNQNVMGMLYMLFLIAVTVNFLGCLW